VSGRRSLLAVGVALCLLAAGCTPSSGAPPRPQLLDIAYASDTNPAHRLDLYLPAGRGPYPLVVFIHGGAWAFGDKAMRLGSRGGYGDLRRTLYAQGYAVASVRYRFVKEARFPAQLYDVKAAVRYLRANARRLNLDARRFVAMGDSAGGQLAEMVGMTSNRPELEGDVGVTGVPSDVRAVVSYFGVSDLVRIFDDRVKEGCGPRPRRPERTREGQLVGGDPEGDAKPLATLGSPITYVDSAPDVPILLFHGTRDCVVPDTQSLRLYDALRAVEKPVEIQLVTAGHADRLFYTDRTLRARLVDFLSRQDAIS